MGYDEELEKLKKENIDNGCFNQEHFCTEDIYNDWCRRGKILFQEAALLSIGLNPDMFTNYSEDLFYHSIVNNSPLLKKGKRTYNVLLKHYLTSMSQKTIFIDHFMTAARQSTIQIPSAFITSYDEYMKIKYGNMRSYQELSIENKQLKETITQLETSPKNKPNSQIHNLTQANRILGQLLYVLAKKHYNYSPDNLRNKATGNNSDSITTLATKEGISISDDTLRKYLNAGHASLEL